MSRWTEKDLQKLQAKGKAVYSAFKDVSIGFAYKKVTIPKSKVKQDMAFRLFWWCKVKNLALATEHVFHPTRKWRADFAIIEKKILIEYEGVISDKSRHTTIKGFTEDLNKYNEAQKLGWIVLRYSALNYKNLITDLNFCLENEAHRR